jgi:hypothetical protein
MRLSFSVPCHHRIARNIGSGIGVLLGRNFFVFRGLILITGTALMQNSAIYWF